MRLSSILRGVSHSDITIETRPDKPSLDTKLGTADNIPKSLLIDPALFSVPPVLYHYTSLTGLLGMVASGHIWATNIFYLNDTSESRQIWNFVRQRLEKRREMADGSTRERLTRIIEATEKQHHLSTDFVACLSEEGDSLGQWRAYCPDSLGVSIGFDSRALWSQWVADPEGGESAFVGHQLCKIRYLPDRSDASLDEEIDCILEQSDHFFKLFPVEQALFGWLALMSSRYKHESFREEKEWRVLMMKPHKPMPHQRFRVGKSSLIPYIEVELNRDLNHALLPDYFIREVCICPTLDKNLAKDAVERLFATKNHSEVRVTSSSIPYRNW